MPQVEAKINLALEAQHDRKAWPNFVDPEALDMSPHFNREGHALEQGLELWSSLPF